jgi:high-affinity Fe2+/Pb2+ permease
MSTRTSILIVLAAVLSALAVLILILLALREEAIPSKAIFVLKEYLAL